MSKSGPVALAGAAFLAVTFGGGSAPAAAPPPTGLVVIGDSLSDNGNAGRFSDGPVWVERLAEGFELTLRPAAAGGTNHAVGGALTRGGPGSLRAQADGVLSRGRRQLDPDLLYIVWGGANDLFAAVFAADRAAVARAAASTVGGIVDDLAAAGAVRILVPNLPDIGLTPAVRSGGPAMAAEARRLSLAYNQTLEQALAGIEERRHVGIMRLDVWTLAERVMADPAAFGFQDVTHPCRGGPACAAALFWDQIHPTAAAHARLARVVLEALGAG